jgi:hypothetical protein
MTETSAPALDESAQAHSTRPTFTITEAAAACAVSRKTITRKLSELADAGAAKDADGIWRIPVEALLSVGLHPGRSLNMGSARREEVVDLRPPVRTATPPQPASDPETVIVSRERWDDLRIRLARAEAESVERGRALDDARLALRALTAGPAYAAPQLPQALQGAPAAEPRSQGLPATEKSADAIPEEAGAPWADESPSGLPPTPVPMSLGADSSVWDTLLPRSASAPAPANAVDPLFPSRSHAARGGFTADPSGGTVMAPVAAPPVAESELAAGTARRRWWGGRR